VSEPGFFGFLSGLVSESSAFTLNGGGMVGRATVLPKSAIYEICAKKDDDNGSGSALFQPF
jgi:hypothetical protein